MSSSAYGYDSLKLLVPHLKTCKEIKKHKLFPKSVLVWYTESIYFGLGEGSHIHVREQMADWAVVKSIPAPTVTEMLSWLNKSGVHEPEVWWKITPETLAAMLLQAQP